MSHHTAEDFEDYDSDDSISVGTEDTYDTESFCSNYSYESSFINDEDAYTNDYGSTDYSEDEFYFKWKHTIQIC